MLRAIAVDDEYTALRWFHRIASKSRDISIEGEFLLAEDAIKFVREQTVDVAFLDIEMPDMDGLELAERLMEIDPYIKVVFITAYNQYALDAFRAHAIGYLLKPVDEEELSEQIGVLTCRYSPMPVRNHIQRLYVKCFGPFSISTGPEEPSAIRWKTAKAEELFALLIHNQGRVKSKESLMEVLWPELDPMKAINLFRVTCTYLRTALAEMGSSDLLVRELDGYKINDGFIDSDLFIFRLAAHSVSTQGSENLEAAAALFSGEYLEGKNYNWISEARIQLENDLKRMQNYLADGYAADGSYDKACRSLERILQYDPCDEDAVARMISIKLHAGDTAAAARVYRRYEIALKDELGVLPSEKLKKMIPGMI